MSEEQRNVRMGFPPFGQPRTVRLRHTAERMVRADDGMFIRIFEQSVRFFRDHLFAVGEGKNADVPDFRDRR